MNICQKFSTPPFKSSYKTKNSEMTQIIKCMTQMTTKSTIWDNSTQMKNLFQVLEMCSKMPKGLLDDFTYFYKSPKSLHTQLPDFSFKSLDPLRNAS